MKDIEIQVGDYVVFYYPDHEENGFRVTSIDEDTVFVLTNDKHLAHGQIVSPGVLPSKDFELVRSENFQTPNKSIIPIFTKNFSNNT